VPVSEKIALKPIIDSSISADPRASFEAHLAREILESERTRTAILAGIFALLLVAFPLAVLVFYEHYARNFHSLATIGYVVSVTGALVAYELLVRRLLARWLRRGGMPPPFARFGNALIETSVPTILILVAARDGDPGIVLQGPAGFLYAVFIVLSTLRLDFALSAFTGLVAASEYVALSFAYAGSQAGAAMPATFAAPGFILLKGLVLFLAGIAAGFVADQLKRRVVNAFRATEERARVVSAFGQQVSPAIVEELLKQGPDIRSKRMFVCVLFMDIRDFTRLVHNKSPEEIVRFQNAVFGAAVEIVNRHQGIINQFLGDGFMATFGAPIATGDECRNGLAAARELIARVRQLSDAGHIPRTSIGIGLHAGEAVTGNIGSEERKQYSITGTVVILAARIEQLNKDYGSQLLVSREVLDACGGQVRDAEPLGSVQVKGCDAPLEIYRIS
jgi:adenylate cyclase